MSAATTAREEWVEPSHNRHRVEMAQLRALLDAWRISSFYDGYDYVRAAEQMIADERAFYEKIAPDSVKAGIYKQ